MGKYVPEFRLPEEGDHGADDYWKRLFEGLETSQYPELPSKEYRPALQSVIEHNLDWVEGPTNLPTSTTLRAAWSLLLAQYTGAEDIVFGTYDAVETGPTNSAGIDWPRTFPLRVRIDWKARIQVLLQTIQLQSTESEAFCGYGGLDRIRKCSSEAQEACQFRTALVIQRDAVDDEAVAIYRGSEAGLFHSQVALLIEWSTKAARQPRFRLHYDQEVVDPDQARHMAFQFSHIVDQLCRHHGDQQRLTDLDMMCEQDQALIWSWNKALPRKHEACVPDIFAQQVRRHAQRQAVQAWDGNLTYAELDAQSNVLASWLLRERIAAPGRMVPVCFDKTVWATVVILAIAKAGSVFVFIDPHQPRARLAAILSGLQYNVMLARPDTAGLARSLAESVFVLEGLPQLPGAVPDRVVGLDRAILPDDHLYAVFTSGSTGTPKGLLISHANLCTAAAHQARALGFGGSRTFDSSSYSFDAYVCNTFHTLLSGGCLCVPSETDRINDLEGVLQRMEVDVVQLTPSTSRVLDPAQLPRLHTLILTGEKISRAALDPWLATGRVRIINAYGPSECTIMCAANRDVRCLKDAESVGFGLGASLWIADTHNVDRLAPVGAVGELLIEGPIVGQGYLNDDQKTREVFIEPPAGGYLPGVGAVSKGPVFRTRDLARYNLDGSICYIGRADTQIKVNGQRVEIGEVEYQLGQCLPESVRPIVEVVQWPSGKRQLLGFVYLGNTESPASLEDLVKDLGKSLTDRLPKYMMPSAYFALHKVPMTSSGKTDRMALRRMALESPDRLVDFYSSAVASTPEDRPLKSTELLLQELWAEVLGLDASSIRPTHSFFSKGGDSLAAMRLVSALHRRGLRTVTVAEVFQSPRLEDLALVLEHKGSEAAGPLSELTPFSLLDTEKGQINTVLELASTLCGCEPTDIEDMYPCSPIQEEMVILASRNPKNFVTQKVVDLPPEIDIERLNAAWVKVLARIPAFRSRIVDMNSGGSASSDLAQVVLKGGPAWSRYLDLDTCMVSEREKSWALGAPLFRVGVVMGNSASIVLTMHHAVYDGWSLDLLGRELSNEYGGQGSTGLVPYKNFIRYLTASNSAEADHFWERNLRDLNTGTLYPLDNPNYKPSASGVMETVLMGLDWDPTNGITPTTMIQAAWAIVLSKRSTSSDVVFGTTLLGRQVPCMDVDRIVGPVISTIPFRVVVDGESQTVIGFLRQIQTLSVEIYPFMHIGIKRIRQLTYDAKRACEFQTFLVVQPESAPGSDVVFDFGSGQDDIEAFNTYALMLECSLSRNGLKIRASFDDKVIDARLVHSMVTEMERVLGVFCKADGSVLLATIFTPEEREAIAQYKAQGQRGHLVQIASHLRECLPRELFPSCAVELVDVPTMSQQLVAFFCTESSSQQKLHPTLGTAMERMSERLPRHMLPTKFLVVQDIPTTPSGEVDSEGLRLLSAQATASSFIDASGLFRPVEEHLQPRSRNEAMLQSLWASTLGVEAASIGVTSSFLSLGGDSLAAMRLAAAARREGYSLTVAEILQRHRLADMARSMANAVTRTEPAGYPSPFSLLGHDFDRAAVAEACGVHPGNIEDVYPCSPLQEGMMASGIRRHGSFVSQGLVPIPHDVDVGRLRQAWEAVIAATPILRTRVVECAGLGMVQVVLKETAPWTEWDALEDVVQPVLGLGMPLLHFALIRREPKTGARALLMTIHHAIHDRWSAGLMLRSVESAYRGQGVPELVPFNRFIQHLNEELDEAQVTRFWAHYLKDLNAPQFPVLLRQGYQAEARTMIKRDIQGLRWPSASTPSTTLRAAWAVLVSLYTNSSEVLFGATVMGRQVPLPGVERIVGPTIATVPIRVHIDWTAAPRALLDMIQKQGTDMIPFEHYGLGKIKRLNADGESAYAFQSLLVVQPPESTSDASPLFSLQVGDADSQSVDGYGISLECTLSATPGAVAVRMTFDDAIVSPVEAQHILAQFERCVQQLCREDTTTLTSLADLDLLTDQDRKLIEAWNAHVPETIDGRLGDIIIARAQEQPCATAVHAWDGKLSYGELLEMSNRLAYHLVRGYGVGPEVVVSVCLEKSLWTPVAMLAVVLAGGVVLTLDYTQPVDRLQSIMEQADASLVLASPTTHKVARMLAQKVEVIEENTVWRLPAPRCHCWALRARGDNALYVTFTSGSTGQPKGAVMTHANCCSAVFHQTARLGISQSSRVLDLASYSFDVVWESFMHTLCVGACLCIPSEHDRRNDIPRAIRELHPNFIDITPSLARALSPADTKGVNSLVFGGESLSIDDVNRWVGHMAEIRNAYGPSECTITSTVALHGEDFTDEVSLGRACGLNAWVVSCIQPNTLAPVGAIGELVLEGPLVGRGYMKEPEKTAAVFITETPAWMIGATEKRRRFYKTGDLVRYDGRGGLIFVGRQDSQIKLRGQRIELEEIEAHARRFVDTSQYTVAVIVIELDHGTQTTAALALFVAPVSSSPPFPTESIGTLTRSLSRSLPSYMVPSEVVPVDHLPLTASGKIDRKKLKQMGALIKADQLRRRVVKEEPKTERQKVLRRLWSAVLGVPEHEIGLGDNFFHVGGDSLSAIRLVGAAREENVPLSVSLIFEHAELSEMAETTLSRADPPPPNGLSDQLQSAVLDHSHPTIDAPRASALLSVREEMIAEVLPVTSFQRYAIQCAFAKPRTEWNYFRIPFGDPVSTSRLADACAQLVNSVEMFRYLFVVDGEDVAQVLLRQATPDIQVVPPGRPVELACTEACLQDLERETPVSAPFARFFILEDAPEKTSALVLRMSHALYDGVSFARLADCIAAVCDGRPLPPVAPFSTYVKTALLRAPESYAFWKSLLQGCPLPDSVFPGTPRGGHRPGNRVRAHASVTVASPPSGATVATLFGAAWGVALSRATGMQDVVFGRAVSGRALTSAAADHETVVGPCLNLVPARVRVSDPDADPRVLLGQLQRQFIESIPHETVGLAEIAELFDEWPRTTDFGSVFYFQNFGEPSATVGGQTMRFDPVPLERPEPPEPPRLDVLPRGGGEYVLELSVHEDHPGRGSVQGLLDAMCSWLSPFKRKDA